MSDTVPFSFDLEALGAAGPARPFSVSASAIAAYASATNDPDASARSGKVAPSVFAIVPAWAAVHDANVAALGEESLARLEDRIVHGEQWMIFHRPIVEGDELSTIASVIGVHPKGSGTTVVARLETRDAAGQGVVEQLVTVFLRGVLGDAGAGEVAPSLSRLVEGDALDKAVRLATVAVPIDDDQPRRYADASGDHHRIHLDDEVARSTGLPGVIVHGMCTLAMATRAVRLAAGANGPAPFAQVGCRFTRPLLPGDELVTTIASLDAPEGRVLSFESRNGAGEVVLGNGYAELARA